MSTELKHHPAAEAFPMMDAKRYAELREDIEANGLRQRIILCEDMILDGRNRYKACSEAGIKPQFETYTGNPWAFAWSLNGQRRDLVAEQRYLIRKHVHENGIEWQAEQKRIQDEANRKRAEAAKAQENRANQHTKTDKSQERPQTVDEPAKSAARGQGSEAKASASKTNRGAVERGDKLAKERPDLAEKVRLGEMKQK